MGPYAVQHSIPNNDILEITFFHITLYPRGIFHRLIPRSMLNQTAQCIVIKLLVGIYSQQKLPHALSTGLSGIYF